METSTNDAPSQFVNGRIYQIYVTANRTHLVVRVTPDNHTSTVVLRLDQSDAPDLFPIFSVMLATDFANSTTVQIEYVDVQGQGDAIGRPITVMLPADKTPCA